MLNRKLAVLSAACTLGFAALGAGCGDDALAPLDADLAKSPAGNGPGGATPGAGSGPTSGPGGPEGPTGDGWGRATPEDMDEINERCENGAETRSFTVKFLDPDDVCDWDQNGNLDKKDAFIRARREQIVNFTLPESSVLCDVNFDFSIDADPQPFWYDDHFMINLDDVTLAASFDFGPELEDNGLWYYRWNSIRDLRWHSQGAERDITYCPGREQGTTRCSFPETDTPGVMELFVSDFIVRSIMAGDADRTDHKVSFVTTGDDNNTDCRHSPIEFELTVTYAE